MTSCRIRQGLALLGALLLAACSSVVPRTQAPPPPPPPPQADVIQGLPTDVERHRVALLVPISGANAGVGRSISNATTMALLDTKTERLRVTTYDTGKGRRHRGAAGHRRGRQADPGPAHRRRGHAPSRRSRGRPVSRSSAIPMTRAWPATASYLLGYSPEQSIERVIGYAKGRGLSNFAALVPKGVYGERAGGAFLAKVKAVGGTVVAMETFRPLGCLGAGRGQAPGRQLQL